MEAVLGAVPSGDELRDGDAAGSGSFLEGCETGAWRIPADGGNRTLHAALIDAAPRGNRRRLVRKEDLPCRDTDGDDQDRQSCANNNVP